MIHQKKIQNLINQKKNTKCMSLVEKSIIK